MNKPEYRGIDAPGNFDGRLHTYLSDSPEDRSLNPYGAVEALQLGVENSIVIDELRNRNGLYERKGSTRVVALETDYLRVKGDEKVLANISLARGGYEEKIQRAYELHAPAVLARAKLYLKDRQCYPNKENAIRDVNAIIERLPSGSEFLPELKRYKTILESTVR